jgi:hypothetical protein
MRNTLDRRQALKLLTGAGVSLYLAPRFDVFAWADEKSSFLDEVSSIDRTIGEVAPKIWFADYPDTAHKVLWDKAGYVASLGGGSPKPSVSVPLVVIGGGISGLTSAYLLRNYKPIVLEQAPRFGGNSKGQSWHGIDHSIGAAYFIKPESDSDIGRLMHELGINSMWKVKSEEGPVSFGGTIYNDFWNGEPAGEDAHAREQILKLGNYFRKVNQGEELTYPDIPITDPEILEYIKGLDAVNFKTHLESIVGEPLVHQVEAVIEQYCWSSLGASSVDVSAASALNFYASEFGEIVVFPGGNAAVAARLLEKISTALPRENLRTNSLVQVVNDGVIVSYRNEGGDAVAIHAQAVVMACPKFIMGKILADIEPERYAAVKRLRYNSYIVANVCIKGGGKAPFYDLYMLGDGEVDTSDVRASANKKKVTDVIFANYANPVAGSTVLTLYRPLPYEGARGELLASDSYGRYREEFEKQIRESILPLLKIPIENMVDLRMARWAHPLPVASPGLIAEGVVDLLRKPFRKRVFFVEQDNWALPAFETAVTEALIWAPEIESLLASKKVIRS